MKKCKGSGKAKGFGCGKCLPFNERNGLKTYKAKYGLGYDCNCYTNWLISGNKEAKKVLESSMVKAKKEVVKKQKLEHKKAKESLIDYKVKLQEKINLIVRLIDLGLPCLARGYHPGQIHAGHIFSRGSSPTIKFNLHNIHRQSAQSNHYQNEDGLLREGLVNEYGQKYFDFISSLREAPQLKYTNEEYKRFYKHASSIANELKKQGRAFPSIQERIFMRNELNNQLSIYPQRYCEFKF